ncbi:hypothetical protein GCM10010129_71950 [Streptomyces fumigatiscleroticus]|nr:hypothetical protein GCM10010129_71950 [Streptomyces fumigatiscleroticus]
MDPLFDNGSVSARPPRPHSAARTAAERASEPTRRPANLHKRNVNIRGFAPGGGLMLNSPPHRLHMWSAELPSATPRGRAAAVPRHRQGVDLAWDRGVRTGARSGCRAHRLRIPPRFPGNNPSSA